MQLIYNFYPQEGLTIYVFPRYQPFAIGLLKRTFTAIFIFCSNFVLRLRKTNPKRTQERHYKIWLLISILYRKKLCLQFIKLKRTKKKKSDFFIVYMNYKGKIMILTLQRLDFGLGKDFETSSSNQKFVGIIYFGRYSVNENY